MPMVITRGAASAKAFGWTNGGARCTPGQQAYTTAGTYCWVAPANVKKVSTVAVGAGGGAGGALTYGNNLAVVPGNSYSLTVGAAAGNVFLGDGGLSKSCISGAGTANGGGTVLGGTSSGGTGGGNGGNGGGNSGGGGGAGGYAGNGGAGGSTNGYNGFVGSGGGGGGGGVGYNLCYTEYKAGGGGGVGILGQSTNGAGGVGGSSSNGCGGGGGSSGAAGGTSTIYTSAGNGGAYGGGGGIGTFAFGYYCCFFHCFIQYPGTGAVGAVRIIWPGCARSFPSTRTANE